TPLRHALRTGSPALRMASSRVVVGAPVAACAPWSVIRVRPQLAVSGRWSAIIQAFRGVAVASAGELAVYRHQQVQPQGAGEQQPVGLAGQGRARLAGREGADVVGATARAATALEDGPLVAAVLALVGHGAPSRHGVP